MARQFSTGFDFYTTATQEWDASSGTVTINSASARFQFAHSQGVTFGSAGFITKNLLSAQATLILGFAIKVTTMPTGGNIATLLEFFDTGTVQVSLGLSSAGVLQFYRNAPTGSPIGSASSSNAFTGGVWHFLEVQVTFATGTGGSVQCWVDGVSVINSSSLNTSQSGTASANKISIGNLSNNYTPVVDDLYCHDTTGGVNDTRLGDRVIRTIVPNGAGSFTNFTPSGAANNWQAIDEIPANDLIDYVASPNVNDRDSYTFESVTLAGNATYLVPKARIAKDDASAHTVSLSATDTGNDAFSSAVAVPSSFALVDGGAFNSSPNGAAAWSQTVINRTEWGLKIVS